MGADGSRGTGASEQLVVAVLGLGEAGSALTADLLDGQATVRAYDPLVPAPPGSVACSGDADAVDGADLVVSVNSAHDAPGALHAGLATLAANAIWADANTGSAQLKVDLAAVAAGADRQFVDVALMAPVPGSGLRTPMLASGSGAERFASMLRPLGATIEVVGEHPGLAATRKLLRSVFYKGMAAAAVEALAAARHAGQEEWLRAHLQEELDRTSAATLDRLVTGTYHHARRRCEEMRAASEMLRDLGVAPHVTDAAAAMLFDIASGKDGGT
ncbi:MAG: DUF1932 domain-containing protein [Actinomycetota bacterium]|nr:DUF1932 domain-containing protein [Actinomycetota bacterium]